MDAQYLLTILNKWGKIMAKAEMTYYYQEMQKLFPNSHTFFIQPKGT